MHQRTELKRTLLFGSLLLLAASCRSQSTLRAMHEASMDEVKGRGLYAGLDPDYEERQAERVQRTREIVAAGGLETAEDYLYAALLLSTSSDTTELWMAEELGREAAQRGDGRGLRVAAEAVDKQLVLQGQPQRYGTQIQWSVDLGTFHLGLVDPLTSDDDRREMGVPPMAELLQRVEMLNAMHAAEQARARMAQ